MGNCLDCLKGSDDSKRRSRFENSLDNTTEMQKQSGGRGSVSDLMDTINEKSGKITDQYQFMNPPLGKGSFGEVRKAVHKTTGIVRAVKIIIKAQTSAYEQQKLLNEVEVLKRLDHPNILKIYEFYQDAKYFYIVSEMCTGGELFDRIQEEGHFSERKAAQIMRQVLSAVFYCHQHKIVHRDLKPENLLYESDKKNANLKVIDFGTSRHIEGEQQLKQKTGTPYYIAPEVLKKKYNEKCDIWSCGVIMYILLCGYPPFNGASDKQVLEHVAKGKYNFEGEEWAQISDEAKQLIRKMLELEPAKRYSAEQCLADPWVRRYQEKATITVPIMKTVIENMKTFRSQQKLQQAAFMYIVNYLTTKEEKNELLKTFQQLDINGDGILTREELLIGYKNILGPHKAEEEVNKIMEEVDKNGSGSIDYSEFVAASINRDQVLSRQRLEMAFKTFDKDGSGFLTVDELKEIFGGGRIPDDVWKQIIGEVDGNGDGEISMAEFKDMMLKMAH